MPLPFMKHPRKTDASAALMRRAVKVIPGGVSSPVRAFKAVGGNPLFIERGEGCYIFDADGNRYTDYVMSWGPLILGHANPIVTEVIIGAASAGSSFGAPTEIELLLAEKVVSMVPSIERIRFVNSGTEATMSALRLARAFTGRPKIVKFEGCYHGHFDGLLVKAGSGVMTYGIGSSAGVTENLAKDTIVARFNDVESVQASFDANEGQIAAAIVEGIPGNMGVVIPRISFFEGVARICREAGALLILDEVMSGFRVAPGGAQEIYHIRPDLTCLGKIIGGGLPVGAYGGRADIMSRVAPEGDVYQAGTLSGNPLAMAAGLSTLEVLEDPSIYEYLNTLGARLASGLNAMILRHHWPLTVNCVGSMLTLFFTGDAVTDYASAVKSDTAAFAKFHAAMLERGFYFPPSQFEAFFLSTEHGEDDVDKTLDATEEALSGILG